MAKHKQKGEIIGFHLSAAIPLARVGYVLRELYNGGHDININPVVAPLPVTSNGHIIGPTVESLGLPAPTKKKGRRGAIKELAMAYFRANDTVTLDGFVDAFRAAGYERQIAVSALNYLRKARAMRGIARHTYTLTPKGKTS